VDADVSTDDEPLGSKEKFWVTDLAGQRWLFKFVRERDGVTRGEDWAECLVHELAQLIGVPTAEVNGRYAGMKRTSGKMRRLISVKMLVIVVNDCQENFYFSAGWNALKKEVFVRREWREATFNLKTHITFHYADLTKSSCRMLTSCRQHRKSLPNLQGCHRERSPMS